jgi:hypothetical protein
MKTIEKTNVTALAQNSNGDGVSSMPGEFAGMYQAGFESGYSSGREAGYRQGFNEGYAAVHQGPTNGGAGASAFEGKTVSKGGPRRMLLGMPCPRCRVYLLSGETHCPSCKQPRKAA